MLNASGGLACADAGRCRTSSSYSTGRRGQSINVKWVSALVVVGVIAGLGWTAGRPSVARAAPRRQLTIETVPAGAQVLVGDTVRGVTPLVLEMPPGTSRVVVRARWKRARAVGRSQGGRNRAAARRASGGAGGGSRDHRAHWKSPASRREWRSSSMASRSGPPRSRRRPCRPVSTCSPRAFPRAPWSGACAWTAGRTTTLHLVSPGRDHRQHRRLADRGHARCRCESSRRAGCWARPT